MSLMTVSDGCLQLSAFAGLRPSEACNVRRADSKLGPGIKFLKENDEIVNIEIDLTHRYNLRSDLISVGGIKKYRVQRVYPQFLRAFCDCYNEYMRYMAGRKFETEYGAMTVNNKVFAKSISRSLLSLPIIFI